MFFKHGQGRPATGARGLKRAFEAQGIAVLINITALGTLKIGDLQPVTALQKAGCRVTWYQGNEISVKGGGGPRLLLSLGLKKYFLLFYYFKGSIGLYGCKSNYLISFPMKCNGISLLVSYCENIF